MFEFLFKFSPVVFREGTWGFREVPGGLWLVGILIAILLLGYLAYRRQVLPISKGLRAALFTLKMTVVLLMLFLLSEPFISVTSVVPKKSTVLVLVDDSQSMGIPDARNGQTRQAAVAAWLGDGKTSGALAALENNFNVQTFRFGESVGTLANATVLQADGKYTDIAGALEFATAQSHASPLSAVVLVTDGAQALPQRESAAAGDPLQALAGLKNVGIPVFTIGVGGKIRNEVQLTRVTTTPAASENDEISISFILHAKQKVNPPVTVEILEEGRVVKSEQVALNAAYTHADFSVQPLRKGYLQYEARVLPLPDEIITENNSKKFLVHNEERTAKVLYIEEIHPFDYKFIRRALDLDNKVNLVSMVRTGPEKFLRQGLLDPHELEDGFPATREKLFAYQAIILGSIEAGFFSAAQHELLKAFVSERGGSLLMLGGPKAFSQGGWHRSPLAEILPVSMLGSDGNPLSESTIHYGPFNLQLTPEGMRAPFLQFSPVPKRNEELWKTLPELMSYNELGAARPAASILAVHPLSSPGRPIILLAEQRFGRGKVMVFATSTSWRWQMQLPSEDQRHERFWRQMVRSLAFNAPDPISVSLEKSTYQPGESVAITVDAVDSSFHAVANAQISTQVSPPFSQQAEAQPQIQGQGDPPSSRVQYVKIAPDLKRPGQFKGDFQPAGEGLYEVEVLANDPSGKYLGRATAAFLVNQENVEFAQPDLQENLLQRLAELSGGKYLPIDEAANIADELSITDGTYSKITERDLWDAPVVYILLIGLLAIEWFVRRSKGLS